MITAHYAMTQKPRDIDLKIAPPTRLGRCWRRLVTTLCCLLQLVMMVLVAALGQAGETLLRINCSLHSPYELFFIEVLSEACRRLDITLERNTPPVGRSLILVNDGIDDGDGPRIGGLEDAYPNLVRVSEPFDEFEFGAFSDEPGLTVDGWRSLAGFEVAYLRGWKIFEENVRYYKRLIVVDDTDELFRLLKNHRADMVLCTRAVGEEAIRRLKLEDVRFLESPLAVEPAYLYLHKQHRALAERLAETLKEMKRDGTYGALVAKIAAKNSAD